MDFMKDEWYSRKWTTKPVRLKMAIIYTKELKLRANFVLIV